ncbi:RNA polymerase II transcription factor SIII subunit A-domain-containing protein [Microdochium bolleyi]|uniref:RNA polymerase II transcription factor SIII subunit A-domain-containing protein n=1 Tax=Microdochium bolleyi TaxID=196109 RepID=A0A136ILZ1_9PEZI|nr:RNA polymerase II transcription factor SIII subunit A-domain-containing protein [Microdochium bolleyi]
MPAKSLIELCTVLCLKHIKEITDIGLTPYPAVRRILLNINSATQLRQLEIASPHLEGDDAECWIRLVEKDFPVLSKKHNFEPRNPQSWHKVYSKYQRLEEELKRAAEEKLKSAMAGIKMSKENNKSSVVDFDRRKLPKLPKDGRGLAGARRGPKGQPIASTNGLRFTGGTKTKVTDAKSIMRKARREAAAIGARNRLDTNSADLRRGQLQHAPKGLVDEYKLQARPAARGMPSAGGRIGVPRPPVPSIRRIDRDLEEREARLRKMTSLANKRENTTVVSDDELEEEDDIGYEYEAENDDDGYGGGSGGLDADELEDIFDEKPAARSSGISSSSNRKTGGGLLSNAPGAGSRAGSSSSTRPPMPSSSSSSSIPKRPPPARVDQHSPPPSRSANGSPAKPPPAGGPPPPGLQRKRKAPVDVFMKKKPKAPRPN